MRGNSLSASRSGFRSLLIGSFMRVLPLAHYTPLRKWMAVSLLTVQQLKGKDS